MMAGNIAKLLSEVNQNLRFPCNFSASFIGQFYQNS